MSALCLFDHVSEDGSIVACNELERAFWSFPISGRLSDHTNVNRCQKCSYLRPSGKEGCEVRRPDRIDEVASIWNSGDD